VSVPNARGESHAISLEGHPSAAPVADLPPREITINRGRRQRQASRHP
jgi:hypothetical protein